MSWRGIFVTSGRFSTILGDGDIEGRFYGNGHKGVTGTFEGNALRGVFGALRE